MVLLTAPRSRMKVGSWNSWRIFEREENFSAARSLSQCIFVALFRHCLGHGCQGLGPLASNFDLARGAVTLLTYPFIKYFLLPTVKVFGCISPTILCSTYRSKSTILCCQHTPGLPVLWEYVPQELRIKGPPSFHSWYYSYYIVPYMWEYQEPAAFQHIGRARIIDLNTQVRVVEIFTSWFFYPILKPVEFTQCTQEVEFWNSGAEASVEKRMDHIKPLVPKLETSEKQYF